MKTIIFAGHFNLGECISEIERITMQDAIQREGHIGIVVGDIGFAQRVLAYAAQGLEGVTISYSERRQRCTSQCVLKQLPLDDQIVSTIDWDCYERVTRALRRYDPSLLEQPPQQNSQERLYTFLREHIVPALVTERVLAQGGDPLCVQSFGERTLRNYAREQMRPLTQKSAKENWSSLEEFRVESSGAVYLGNSLLRDEHGTPHCRAIMLALYEQLSKQGYERVIELYPASCSSALINAHTLYEEYVASKLPQTKNLKFECMFY